MRNITLCRRRFFRPGLPVCQGCNLQINARYNHCLNKFCVQFISFHILCLCKERQIYWRKFPQKVICPWRHILFSRRLWSWHCRPLSSSPTRRPSTYPWWWTSQNWCAPRVPCVFQNIPDKSRCHKTHWPIAAKRCHSRNISKLHQLSNTEQLVIMNQEESGLRCYLGWVWGLSKHFSFWDWPSVGEIKP